MGTRTPRRMRATTLRFSEELWTMLDAEAAAAGVSVAQYIREAALARVMFETGRRGDQRFETAMDEAATALGRPPADPLKQRVTGAGRRLEELLDDSRALSSQGELARSRARRITRGERPSS